MAPREIEDLQEQFDEGMGHLMGDDRVGGVSSESCRDGARGLVRRDQQGGGFSSSRRPGPAERVSDPVGCAVRMLNQDEPRRAKAILVLSGGTAEPLGWTEHLKEILSHGITVYVCTVPTQPTPGLIWSSKSQRRFPGPPTIPVPGGARQTSAVSVPPVDDGLDYLVDVSGGTRVLLDGKERRLPALFKEMKDAMLLGYYPPDQPGLHNVRVDLRRRPLDGSMPPLRYQTEYYQ
jgi:hypothetical protein